MRIFAKGKTDFSSFLINSCILYILIATHNNYSYLKAVFYNKKKSKSVLCLEDKKKLRFSKKEIQSDNHGLY